MNLTVCKEPEGIKSKTITHVQEFPGKTNKTINTPPNITDYYQNKTLLELDPFMIMKKVKSYQSSISNYEYYHRLFLQ